jgi:pilus assembly protein CpaB
MANKPGPGVIILLAVILGVVTAVLAYKWASDLKQKSEENWQPVVVAVVDIKPRTTVTREMIQLTRYPQDTIAPEALTDIKQVEGRITLGKIKAKEQIRQSDLVQKGQSPSLAFTIPAGKRAIAIGAGEVMAAGGTVKPGDHVDVLATYTDPVSKLETTQMILQNVPVLAINEGETDAQGVKGAKSSMTLAVSPEEAELITAADRAGVLRVALRPVEDQTIVPSPGTRIKDLRIGGQSIEVPLTEQRPIPQFAPPSREERRAEIKIIRGTQEQVVTP